MGTAQSIIDNWWPQRKEISKTLVATIDAVIKGMNLFTNDELNPTGIKPLSIDLTDIQTCRAHLKTVKSEEKTYAEQVTKFAEMILEYKEMFTTKQPTPTDLKKLSEPLNMIFSVLIPHFAIIREYLVNQTIPEEEVNANIELIKTLFMGPLCTKPSC